MEFQNGFMLREGQIIPSGFKQKKMVGEKTLLILNRVVYAHETQNLHLEYQCYIHVWNSDFRFGQTLTITLN